MVMKIFAPRTKIVMETQWLLVMKTFVLGTKIEMETIPAYHENSLIGRIRIFHRLFWVFV